ncbi:hypothetical protein K505DRAFT_368909 [Melanomma pulvis-pyrius CBS 109.77]|uniref:Uncharacterized protein n=1 Tax=Melanomma pulvis-pyrius CBS 109.77 TaxID=1314802 RepID=A0A6A6WNM4_9PLEO|nr:hypothetical protein K505DRAFT_368909 [Melanomma pulvis-pyrius CBS 109.77]
MPNVNDMLSAGIPDLVAAHMWARWCPSHAANDEGGAPGHGAAEKSMSTTYSRPPLHTFFTDFASSIYPSDATVAADIERRDWLAEAATGATAVESPQQRSSPRNAGLGSAKPAQRTYS